jgi:acetoin:2,6-dichlorophenolindophenol oxidoreductase subunit alpha
MAMGSSGGVPAAEVLREIFVVATRIKLADERFRTLIGSGQAFLIYYSPRGQELIPASFAPLLRRDDYVLTTYRGLHDHIAKGVELKALWAEFFGRSGGTCKGKGGPMHITDPGSGLMVTTGIVGGGLPIATGFGLAAQSRGTDQVTVVNFGDGASNIGGFHEALNLAGVWKLPVVFVCQNNRYAEHTPFSEGTSVAEVSARAAGYGMPGVTVDGNDALAMFGAAREAVERARSGGGPTLIEANTYRFFGHLLGDSMEYQPAEERAAAIEADPVPRFRGWLIAEGILDEDEVAGIEAAVAAEIDEAVEFAQASPPPDDDELFTDVYAEVLR